MSKKLRRVLLVSLGLLGLFIVAAAIVVPRLIDVERYRPQVERALEETTGWEAELGSMKLSLLSGSLSVEPASLRAPGGDSSELEIGRIDVNAKLWPLLRKRLEIESILFVRPRAVLARPNAKTGWIVPFVATEEAPAPTPPATTPATPSEPATPAQGETASEGSGFEVHIGRIGLRDGSFTIDDRASQPPLKIELNNVDATYLWDSGDLSGGLKIAGDRGSAKWSGTIGDTLEVELAGLPTELLHDFLGPDLVHGGGTLSGKVTVATPLRVTGHFDADALTLMSGERSFGKAALDFELAPEGAGWKLDSLAFHGDGATITGAGPLTPKLALRLEMPETDLDAALAAAPAVLPLPLDVKGPGKVSAKIRVDQPAGGDLVYDAEGRLSAAEIRPGDLLPPARDAEASFTLSRAGRLDVKILRGTVAGGAASGGAFIDPVYPPGKLRFTGALHDAVFGQLLGGMVAQAQPVTGPTGFDAQLGIDLTRSVLDARALSGKVAFDANKLSVPGWDLEGAMRKRLEEKLGSGASGLLEGILGKDKKQVEEKAQETAEKVAQVIESLRGTVDFDRFPWGLEDVALKVGNVDSNGQGTFDPESGTVDFALVARLGAKETTKLVERQKALRTFVDADGRLRLPVRVKGSMLRPQISVDVSEALKGKDTKSLLKGLLEKK